MTSAGPGKFVIGLHSHEHVGLEPEGPNLSLLLNEHIDLSPEMALKLEAAEIIANISVYQRDPSNHRTCNFTVASHMHYRNHCHPWVERAGKVGLGRTARMARPRLERRSRRPWSLTVTGNWRLIVRFDGGDAYDLDLVDYR